MAETTQLHLTGGDLIDARRVAVLALLEATHDLSPECQRTAAEFVAAVQRVGLYCDLVRRLGGDPSWPVAEYHGELRDEQVEVLRQASREARAWAVGGIEDIPNLDDYEVACNAVREADIATAESILELLGRSG